MSNIETLLACHTIGFRPPARNWKKIGKNACNLIWRALLGFQDVMKQQEIRRNKEKKTKKLRKKNQKCNKNRHDFVAVFVGHFWF